MPHVKLDSGAVSGDSRPTMSRRPSVIRLTIEANVEANVEANAAANAGLRALVAVCVQAAM